jgi:hypothetical protein
MLYREVSAVFSEIHRKHTNTLCGQNVEFVNVKTGGPHSIHWDVTFKQPTYTYVNARKKTHIEICITFLGKKEIYCSFKT